MTIKIPQRVRSGWSQRNANVAISRASFEKLTALASATGQTRAAIVALLIEQAEAETATPDVTPSDTEYNGLGLTCGARAKGRTCLKAKKHPGRHKYVKVRPA